MFKQADMRLLKRIDSWKYANAHTETDRGHRQEEDTDYATPLTEGPGFLHMGGSLVGANSLRAQLAIRVGVGKNQRGPHISVSTDLKLDLSHNAPECINVFGSVLYLLQMKLAQTAALLDWSKWRIVVFHCAG